MSVYTAVSFRSQTVKCQSQQITTNERSLEIVPHARGLSEQPHFRVIIIIISSSSSSSSSSRRSSSTDYRFLDVAERS